MSDQSLWYPATYSQFGEELFIQRILSDAAKKDRTISERVLDIGAWNPKVFSNSRKLIEQGWRAVLIEPSPGPLKDLMSEYGKHENVEVVAAAVVCEDLKLTQMEISDDGLSTNDVQTIDKWREQAAYLGKLWVPTLRLKDVFNQWGGAFDVVSIDTEGTSVDLAIEYIRAGPRPLCMIVEYDKRLDELIQATAPFYTIRTLCEGTNVVLELR